MTEASGVLGEAKRAVCSDMSLGEADCSCAPSKSLNPAGMWMTDWGSLSDRSCGGSEVTILGGRSCRSQHWISNGQSHHICRTLFALIGLLISLSAPVETECGGESTSLSSSSSCASSSISVPSVPFESTGDGSICCGYGMGSGGGGGASESVGPEELCTKSAPDFMWAAIQGVRTYYCGSCRSKRCGTAPESWESPSRD